MNRTWFSIENKAGGTAEIFIYDEIGAFGISGARFVEALAQVKASNISLRINSPGGNVFDGVTMYNALRRHSATVTSHIDGVAASIASVVALAGDTVRIADNAFFMIHDPFALVVGTAEDMRKAADTLDQVAKATIIAAYMKKTNAAEQQVKDWMSAETWFSAEEAFAAGFVDVIDTDENMKDIVDFTKFNFKHIPSAIAARIRNAAPAAPGTEQTNNRPGASGTPVKATPTPPKAKDQMTIKDQITQFENTRASKTATRDELMKAAAEKGETLDAAQAETYDTLQTEIVAIDQHIVRLRTQEKEDIAAATAVANVTSTATATAARGGASVVVARDEKLAPGIEFARFAMCMAAAEGNVVRALALAETHYPKQQRAINVLKAASQTGAKPSRLISGLMQMQATAVPAGTTTEQTWAAPLVEYNEFAGDFLEYLRPRTVLGQLNGLRRIPFNVHIKGRTSGGTASWVGEGKAKPTTKYDYVDAYHGFAKLACIAVLTDELVRFSNPSAEANVREALSETIIAKMDNDFVDPDIYYIANVRPASITRGVASINSSGDDADDVRTDLAALWADPVASNMPMTSAVYITTPAIALSLSLMTNPLGQPEFGDITMNGGTLRGVKVVVSNYIPTGLFILAFESEIYLSDDGVVTIDASREASIEMDNAPSGDSGDGTGAELVSMWQTNSLALRAERYINWSKRRTNAVSYLRNVGWGGAIES